MPILNDDDLRRELLNTREQIRLAKDELIWDGVPFDTDLTIYGMIHWIKDSFPEEWGTLRDAMLRKRGDYPPIEGGE